MSELKSDLNEPAPENTVYVCGACGKTSPTASGYSHENERVAKDGWDSSCMSNHVLCHEDKRVDDTGELTWWAVTNEDFDGGRRRIKSSEERTG